MQLVEFRRPAARDDFGLIRSPHYLFRSNAISALGESGLEVLDDLDGDDLGSRDLHRV